MADQEHTIVALVRDQPGVLNRVASLIRRRGFNISSLAVGHSEIPDLSRMIFIVDGDEAIVEQVTKQLRKLIDVVRVSDISAENIISRELALIQVKATAHTRSEIMQLVDIFRAAIVDVAPESVIIEVTGDEEKLESLLRLLRPFGIKEIMRSGRLAMVRGMAAAEAEGRERSNGHG
ncbi:MAG: acetolactate synthase small subunit [Chloroflexi bacterium]|nr:acetolactate synthase small subunit [Chloroflexota bacterium]